MEYGYRLLRADLIKLWRVMQGDLLGELLELVSVAPDSRAGGHRFKLLVPACQSEMLRRFFGIRCVSVWKGLPSERGLDENLGDVLYVYRVL